jgi:virginiamycin B lyase
MVVKVSTSGTILATFNLPANSFPVAIVTGPDRNLWIAENGARKIARMTAAGAVTQFALPTTASVADITAVPATGVLADGALWFTDGSSKIGRITTSGAITEYSTPTAGSDPRHIIPCPISICGVYGGVWFTEDGLNRVARFDFSH